MTIFKLNDFDGNDQDIDLTPGDVLFIAGKNGSGKSTLCLNWARQHPENSILMGNREVSFQSSGVDLSPQRINSGHEGAARQIRHNNAARTNRSEHNDQSWLSTTLGQLDALRIHLPQQENQAHRNDLADDARKLEQKDPIVQINQVFESIGLHWKISVDKTSTYMVKKDEFDAEFGIQHMSDGERAALILISKVILAEDGQTITIDEPERHMHRSISSPLLRELIRRRPELTWIISTHDVALLRDFTEAKLLVLYDYNGQGWKYDLLENTSDIPDEVVDGIFAARERVLFVEGEKGRSLDAPLYQKLFPNTTITPRGTCNDVFNAVKALNDIGALNSMEARGIIDADNRAETESLQGTGVAQLKVYAIESLYYHPTVIRSIASHMEKGNQVDDILKKACDAIDQGTSERAAKTCAEHAMRAHFRNHLPTLANLRENDGVQIIELSHFDKIEENMRSQLIDAKENKDWQTLVELVKVKSTPVPKLIAEALGLKIESYKTLALKKIEDDGEVCDAIKDLVPDPFALN